MPETDPPSSFTIATLKTISQLQTKLDDKIVEMFKDLIKDEPVPSVCPCGCDTPYVYYADDNLEEVRLLREIIPGLKDAKVPDPCGLEYCSIPDQPIDVPYLVVHLNDEAYWTREEIADWLDTLDLDLGFKTDGD